MTNYEFIKQANIEDLAKFLITSPDEDGEPEIENWDKEMLEAIVWLNSEFNEKEFNSHHKSSIIIPKSTIIK